MIQIEQRCCPLESHEESRSYGGGFFCAFLMVAIQHHNLSLLSACSFGGLILLERGEEVVMSRRRKAASVDSFLCMTHCLGSAYRWLSDGPWRHMGSRVRLPIELLASPPMIDSVVEPIIVLIKQG